MTKSDDKVQRAPMLTGMVVLLSISYEHRMDISTKGASLVSYGPSLVLGANFWQCYWYRFNVGSHLPLLLVIIVLSTKELSYRRKFVVLPSAVESSTGYYITMGSSQSLRPELRPGDFV